MEKGHYPASAIEQLKIQNERLEFVFTHVWSILSRSAERDEVMWHIMTAKHKLNQIIKENE